MKSTSVFLALSLLLSAGLAFYIYRVYTDFKKMDAQAGELTALQESLEAMNRDAKALLLIESQENCLRMLRALELYYAEKGEYPSDLGQLFTDGVVPALLDAWQRPLHYEGSPTNYTFTSSGPDRVFGTGDDRVLKSPGRKTPEN